MQDPVTRALYTTEGESSHQVVRPDMHSTQALSVRKHKVRPFEGVVEAKPDIPTYWYQTSPIFHAYFQRDGHLVRRALAARVCVGLETRREGAIRDDQYLSARSISVHHGQVGRG